MSLVVVQPGLLTTVQDLGRPGFQRFGVPVSGAMDPFALQVANLLVGNDPGDAALEITLIGPTLHVKRETVIAVCGGDLSPRLNGRPLPLWQSVAVPADSTIAFGPPRSGCRAYLAVAGGLAVPLVMGSRSTYVRGRLGGWHGRPLQAGDELPVGAPRIPIGRVKGRGLRPADRPVYRGESEIRVIRGPQDDAFTDDALACFLSASYRISARSDRMGFWLEGPPLQHRRGADIISDSIPMGAIQVPGSGEPVVLMADRQTTGGYAKIAVVIGHDIPALAQMKPGDRVAFRAVDVETARLLRRRSMRLLHWLQEANRALMG